MILWHTFKHSKLKLLLRLWCIEIINGTDVQSMNEEPTQCNSNSFHNRTLSQVTTNVYVKFKTYRVSQKEVPPTLKIIKKKSEYIMVKIFVWLKSVLCFDVLWKKWDCLKFPFSRYERLNTTTLEPSSPRLCIEMYTLCSRIYQ